MEGLTPWTQTPWTQANEVATGVNPLGHATSYAYDLDGEVTSMVNADDQTITYSYDSDGDETGQTWLNPLGGSALDLVTITYDADGEMTQIQRRQHRLSVHVQRRRRGEHVPDAGSPGLPKVTLTYEYDADGNRTSMDDSLGGLVSYTYNQRDELTNETLSGTGISADAVANTYDNAGNMTGQTRYSKPGRDSRGRSHVLHLRSMPTE